MEDNSNLRRSALKTALIVSILFILIFLISIIPGKVSMKSCLAALILSIIAGSISFLPLMLKSDMSIILILSASAFRFLLMIAGSAIIVLFIGVNVLWFVGWIALFYMVLLFAEIYFAIQLPKILSKDRLN